MVKRIFYYAVLGVVSLVLIAFAILFYQSRWTPEKNGQYVALGSSFAAGIGLGDRAPGSPFICMRSMHGYPRLLAQMAGLNLVDLTCSGSTTSHILHGGPFFLRSPLDSVGPDTQLVTITSGGNDVSYIGDLTLASGGGLFGRLFWKGPEPIDRRDFAKVEDNLDKIVREIRARAPSAKVMLISYPTILPAEGNCPKLGVSNDVANMGRQISSHLLATTRRAAERSGALFVDLVSASPEHHVCADEPWVNGAKGTSEATTPFHPNAIGAQQTAGLVWKAIQESDRGHLLRRN